MIRMERLDNDAAIAKPRRVLPIEVRSADGVAGDEGDRVSFTHEAEILMPFLLDLPLRSHGNFTDLLVDLHGPSFPENPDNQYEVDLVLRGETLGTKTFRNFTQRHQFIVSTQVLFEDVNELTVVARRVAGGTVVPRFVLRLFYAQRERLRRNLESASIWLFSTARSGSTWLSQDLLCERASYAPDGRTRYRPDVRAVRLGSGTYVQYGGHVRLRRMRTRFRNRPSNARQSGTTAAV